MERARARDGEPAVKAVVVGGGLAGAAAAWALAQRRLEVVLVRRGPGATALCWGTLDVAGASPDPTGLPWRDPVRGEPLTGGERLAFLLRSRPGHPYGVLFPGRDAARAARAVKDATAALDGWLRPCGLGVEGSLDETRLLANVRGAVRVCDFAFSDAAGGDVARAETLVLIDLPALPGYDARAAARALGAELAALGVPGRSLRVERPAWPERMLDAAACGPARLAALLDEDEAAAELARALAAPGGEGRTLLFPPVLGLARGERLRRALGAASGATVAELLGAPPWSPAGLRLDRALLEALGRSGVEVHTGRAAQILRRDGRATGVEVEAPEGRASLPARCVVLATGRFTGGGLGERDDRVCEALLDLPVFDEWGRRLDRDPARRSLRRPYADPQPLFAGGVRTDGRLRPLDAAGRPALANLVAAGELIGGFDPALQHTGLGFALLSGLRAGEEAAHLAREVER